MVRRMKRKLHPHRRHPAHHISAQERREFRESGYMLDFLKGSPAGTPGPFPVFPRAHTKGRRHPSLGALVEAGYRFASLSRNEDWTAAHEWLQANCVNRYGREYTWFGGTFVFARPEHHAAFIREFACADGYRPMFAFEVGR